MLLLLPFHGEIVDKGITKRQNICNVSETLQMELHKLDYYHHHHHHYYYY